MSNVKVLFFTVKESNTKLRVLLQTITSHFSKKEKIQIIVPDKATLEFVDLLLWKEPKESFLPHSTEVLLPFQDLIFISFPLPSLEIYPIVFNLCQTCLYQTSYPTSSSLKILYELEDLSHPQKAEAFQNKFKHYQKMGFTLCAAEQH